MKLRVVLLIFSLSVSSLVFGQVDSRATVETKVLYKKLMDISKSFKRKQKILLGQQAAFTEGRGWRHHNEQLGTPLRSDMFDATGVHPAVFGLDFDEIGDWNQDFIRERIELVHQAEGVITLSWHMKSLVKDFIGSGSANDLSTKVTARILPGGSHHEVYKKELDRFIVFMKSISHVPVIFRPFHEHNGQWFWWGPLLTSEKEYISLWKFTVDYLWENGVHNMLLGYSPVEYVLTDYLKGYPGDNYVDIFGIDMYFLGNVKDRLIQGNISPQYRWKRNVINLLKLATKHNKIPALTEFGQEGLTFKNFWTDYMSWPMEKAGMLQYVDAKDLPDLGFAYVMLWRNDPTDRKHFYGPFPGHKLNDNFMDMLSKKIYVGLDL
jgi:mannan endo-1,4-beta-mannosidase